MGRFKSFSKALRGMFTKARPNKVPTASPKIPKAPSAPSSTAPVISKTPTLKDLKAIPTKPSNQGRTRVPTYPQVPTFNEQGGLLSIPKPGPDGLPDLLTAVQRFGHSHPMVEAIAQGNTLKRSMDAIRKTAPDGENMSDAQVRAIVNSMSKTKTGSITPVALMDLASLKSERKKLRADVMSPQLGTAALGGAIGAIAGGVLAGRSGGGGKVSTTAALGGALGALALPSLRKHLKKRRLVSVERRIGNISKRSLGV